MDHKKARLVSVSKNYTNGRWLLTFEMEDDIRYLLDKMKDVLLSLTAKKYRNGRSYKANSYYWKLLTELAYKLENSNACMHNILLRKYGQVEVIGGKLVHIVLPDTDEADKQALEATTYHIMPTEEAREGKYGAMYRTYLLLRGSKTYDTKEMSRLIEGLISDCHDQDIDTITPDEYKRMMELYENQWRKKHEDNSTG